MTELNKERYCLLTASILVQIFTLFTILIIIKESAISLELVVLVIGAIFIEFYVRSAALAFHDTWRRYLKYDKSINLYAIMIGLQIWYIIQMKD